MNDKTVFIQGFTEDDIPLSWSQRRDLVDDAVLCATNDRSFYDGALPLVVKYLKYKQKKDRSATNIYNLARRHRLDVDLRVKDAFADAIVKHYEEEALASMGRSNTPTINNTETPPKEKELMSTNEIKVTTKTLINGKDFTEMTDDQCFTIIASMEKEIDKLNNLGVKPKALVKRINTLQKGIDELVKLMDERTGDE